MHKKKGEMLRTRINRPDPARFYPSSFVFYISFFAGVTLPVLNAILNCLSFYCPRASKSLKANANKIASQKPPAAAAIRFSPGLLRKCIK